MELQEGTNQEKTGPFTPRFSMIFDNPNDIATNPNNKYIS